MQVDELDQPRSSEERWIQWLDPTMIALRASLRPLERVLTTYASGHALVHDMFPHHVSDILICESAAKVIFSGRRPPFGVYLY